MILVGEGEGTLLSYNLVITLEGTRRRSGRDYCRGGAMTDGTTVRARILDIAIMLAEDKSWEAVRLQEVASRASLTLEDIRAEFSEKDELGRRLV